MKNEGLKSVFKRHLMDTVVTGWTAARSLPSYLQYLFKKGSRSLLLKEKVEENYQKIARSIDNYSAEKNSGCYQLTVCQIDC